MRSDDSAPRLALAPRLRRSPYYDAAVRYGARTFSLYNRMLLPSKYAGIEAEYWSLINDVTIWDVGCQRQVEIVGPEAAPFVQRLVTRDVARIKPGRARYTMVCNHEGGVLNDPVMLRLGANHFWLSLADRDILLWAQALAAERGADVTVREPDVSPLQVQGLKSRALMGDVFGDEIRSLAYYRLAETHLEGVPLVVSRTGWSGELGYEVFLCDGSRGDWLWDRLFAAGEPYDVAPAAPNQIRRVEAGILSYGTDMDESVSPLELGLGRLVDLDTPDDFVGRTALEAIAAQGVTRLMTGLLIDGDPLRRLPHWLDITVDGAVVGWLSSAIYSPRFEANLGLALLDTRFTEEGTGVRVEIGDGRTAVTHTLPFVESIRD